MLAIISLAVLVPIAFLASGAARWVTGDTMVIDGGSCTAITDAPRNAGAVAATPRTRSEVLLAAAGPYKRRGPSRDGSSMMGSEAARFRSKRRRSFVVSAVDCVAIREFGEHMLRLGERCNHVPA